MSSRLAPKHVHPDRPRPRAEPASGAAEQPVELALGDARLVEHLPQVADAGIGLMGPAEQLVEIAGEAGDAVAFHFETDVAPGTRLDPAEIIVGDVEAADDDPALVCQRQLLVVAEQIAPAIMRAEAAEGDDRRRARAGRRPCSRSSRSRRRAVRPERRVPPPRSARREPESRRHRRGTCNRGCAGSPAPRRSGRSAHRAAPAHRRAGSAGCRRPRPSAAGGAASHRPSRRHERGCAEGQPLPHD